MNPPIGRRRALAELVFAGAIWGFGFVATIWALRGHSPVELLLWRYILAVTLGEFVWWFFLRGNLAGWRSDLRLAVPAGALLASFLLPQTIGLQFTTAAKSGFLTTFYIILVPILNWLFFRDLLRTRHVIYALIALTGAALMMGTDLSTINPGDLWTLLCALMAAVHILYIGRVSGRIQDPFRFNTFQSLICLGATLPLLTLQDEVRWWSNDPQVWAGIVALAVGSSVIAFTIQVRAQRVLSSMTSAMLFLLESPFALIFGILLLNETLSAEQALGAVLILTAASLTVRAD